VSQGESTGLSSYVFAHGGSATTSQRGEAIPVRALATRTIADSEARLGIATDDGLLDLLTEHWERVVAYLQYGGQSEFTYRHHRRGDLRRLKPGWEQ
jgi:hypothetical protein